MINCPKCGRLHDDAREFCECGEPLHGATVVDPGQAAATPAAGVLLSLRLPEHDTGGPVRLALEAGGRATLIARIRNQSGIVDNYDLRLEGLPDGWWTIVPPTVYLLPLGTEGSYEGDIEITIHPPRSPDAEAREWSFDVVAGSRAFDQDVARATGSVVIAPYTRVDLAVRPQRVRGRRRARVAVAIQNRGNAVSELQLTAVDTEDACRFDIPRPALALNRGEGVVHNVAVRPRRWLIIGRPIDRPFDVVARTPVLDEEPISGAATFVQRPYLPWWLGIVVPLLLAALVLFLVLRPDTVEVPDLTKARSVIAAQNMLEEADLELDSDITRRRTADRPAGSILAQSPKPGEEVEEGDAVTIAVAVGTGQSKVPKVVSLDAAAAESKLTDRGFTVGATEPRLDPEFIVEAQIPKAGQMRATGTPVNLFLGPPPPKKRDRAAGGDAGPGAGPAGPGGAGDGGGDGGLVVPDIEGASLKRSTRELVDAGLVRGAVRRVINLQKRGTVITSRPAPGKPAEAGQKVDVVLSAGFPRLAFGDGTRVLTAAGATGRAARVVAADVASRQPAWTPDGDMLAYVADGRVFAVDPRDRAASPTALTPVGPDNYAHPSFAPSAGRVLAFVRARDGDGDLCFARIRRVAASTPRCIADGDVDLNGRPSWSPRGTTLLVPGVVPGTGGQRFGVVRYRSATPFSPRPSDWGRGEVVTDLARAGRGVIRAAYSPSGKRMALVSNQRGSSFRVVITKPSDFLLRDADVLPVPACDLAWRPDGRELAVVIADPECANRTGALVRLKPSRPGRLTAVRLRAGDPAWQPVELGR